MDAGQTWLMNMSIRCDDVEALSRSAMDEDFEFAVEDVVVMFEISFSTV